MSQERFDAMFARMQQLTDLAGAAALLGWDMHTHMPPKGAPVRAERMATLSATIHGLQTSAETGKLIAEAEEFARAQGDDSFEFAVWKDARREFDKATLIPTELATELARAHSLGNHAWMEARKNNDYESFKPFLKHNYELAQQVIDLTRSYYPDAEEDYDILLDDYEMGMKTREIAAVFDAFKEGARPLVEKVAAHAGDDRDKVTFSHFPAADQEKLVTEIVKAVGFTDDAWDLTVTTHPFESSMAINDIRITTKYQEDFFNPSFFGTLHEFGHGLYEHQIDEKYERTTLGHGVSMAWHESQSRMWENLIGRSLPFWKWATPKVKAVFGEQFAGMEAEDIYRAVNAMGPSLIRIEADELTYNYHIIIRFELERELLAGTISFDDLPAAWNAKIKDYLGIDVPSDSDGVLQDVHWSFGSIGYFPTYALGNVLGAMLWKRINTDLPNLTSEIEAGEFGSLREWSREHIHQYGSHFSPTDLMEKVLGTRTLCADPLLEYLSQKVDELYG